MIIDFHTHVDEVLALGWHLAASDVLAQMDAAGVDQAVVMTITDAPEVNEDALAQTAATCAASAGRLHGFVRVHPWYEQAPELVAHALDDLGYRGVKLHGVSTLADPGSEPVLRVLRAAAARGAPVLFHSGDDPFVTPWEIAPAAAAVPQATIVLAHMGGYAHTADALDVADEFPNVMLDTSAAPYPSVIGAAVRRLGAHRVLFGSDAPGCPVPLELAKIRLAGLSDAATALVLGENARRLLDGVGA